MRRLLWCSCGVCKYVEENQPDEQVCCMSVEMVSESQKCVTTHENFLPCLEPTVLKVISRISGEKGECRTDDNMNRNNRHMSYRAAAAYLFEGIILCEITRIKLLKYEQFYRQS